MRDRRLAGGAVHVDAADGQILIPYQNGTPIDRDLVMLYLGGLLASALVAWGLGWARTYILALVSERMGADLRTTTYQHLLALSGIFRRQTHRRPDGASVQKPTASTSSCRCTCWTSPPTC